MKTFLLSFQQHCFTISYRRENQRHYELKCNTESECSAWIIAIREARLVYATILIKNLPHIFSRLHSNFYNASPFVSLPASAKSFNKLLLQKEELEQKHVHLLQVVESEKTAKWQYTQQCEELASEIRKLRAEVN